MQNYVTKAEFKEFTKEVFKTLKALKKADEPSEEDEKKADEESDEDEKKEEPAKEKPVEEKKEESDVSSRLSSLESKVSQIAEALKPKETVEECKKEGESGQGPENLKIEPPVQDKEPAIAGDKATTNLSAVLKELREIKKSLGVTSSVPRPDAESTYVEKAKEVKKDFAMEVLKSGRFPNSGEIRAMEQAANDEIVKQCLGKR